MIEEKCGDCGESAFAYVDTFRGRQAICRKCIKGCPVQAFISFAYIEQQKRENLEADLQNTTNKGKNW